VISATWNTIVHRATSQGSDQPGQLGGGHGVGGQRPRGGRHERPRHTQRQGEGEQGSDRGGRGRDVERDENGHDALAQRAERGHAAPVEPVGDGPGDEHQQRRGGELGQAQQPEVELAAGQVVDLLAERGHERGRPRRLGEEPDQHGDGGAVPAPLGDGRGLVGRAHGGPKSSAVGGRRNDQQDDRPDDPHDPVSTENGGFGCRPRKKTAGNLQNRPDR
jgi:hypothetical protein